MTSVATIKDNGFTLHSRRVYRYPATKITDADYIDVLAVILQSDKSSRNPFPESGKFRQWYQSITQIKQNM